jgi:hypothetical protein
MKKPRNSVDREPTRDHHKVTGTLNPPDPTDRMKHSYFKMVYEDGEALDNAVKYALSIGLWIKSIERDSLTFWYTMSEADCLRIGREKLEPLLEGRDKKLPFFGE